MEFEREARFVKIVFVYNVNSGLLSLLADAGHRAVRPSTYPCRLCAVTYTFTGMRREWRAFVAALGHPVEFLHRDELEKAYGISDVALPAVFLVDQETARLLIAADEINDVQSLTEWMSLVGDRLSQTVAG